MVRQTAQTLAAVHRIGLSVVSVAPDAVASECLRAALATVAAPVALILAPDCLPDGPGWLSRWRRQTGTRSGACATLISTDAAVAGEEAAGMAIGLNAAAMALLVGEPPRLTSVAADIAARPALRRVPVRGVSVTVYGSSDCPLVDAAERLAAERLREGAGV